MTDHERAVAYWRAFKAALPPTSVEAIAAAAGKRLGVKLAYATTENAIKRAIDPDDPTAKDRPNQKVPASELDAVLRGVLGGCTDEIVARACRAAAAAVVAAITGESVEDLERRTEGK